MEVKAKITSESLTEGIKFHGETNADDDTVERIKELGNLLEDVFYQLERVTDQVYLRHEASAKRIAERLALLKSDLKTIYFDEVEE